MNAPKIHTPEDCPYCGRKLKGLMAATPSKPGFVALLRGEGEDLGLNLCAWAFALMVVFGAASAVFWALGVKFG